MRRVVKDCICIARGHSQQCGDGQGRGGGGGQRGVEMGDICNSDNNEKRIGRLIKYNKVI